MSRGQCWSKTLNHLWGFSHEERPYMRQKLTTKNHLRIGQNCCHCPCNWLQDCQLEIHPAWCHSIYQAELCYYQELELNFVQNGWYKIILVFWDWTVKFSSKCIKSTPAYFGHPINLLEVFIITWSTWSLILPLIFIYFFYQLVQLDPFQFEFSLELKVYQSWLKLWSDVRMMVWSADINQNMWHLIY